MSADDSRTGGPAFPLPNGAGDDGRRGMSLRDYFAAAALPGIQGIHAALISIGQGNNLTEESMARDAYGMADAMLKAKEKAP